MDHCENEISEEFENKIISLLENLRKFDLRTVETKPSMAKARKRLVFGAMETRKQLELGKVKALIIAKNLSSNQLLDRDFKFCIKYNEEIVKIYALTRKQLGVALLNQTSRIGIVGILKLDSVYEIWNEITKELKVLQESWIQKYENDSKFIWQCAFYGHFDLLKRIFEVSCDQRTFINQGCFKTGKTPLLVAVERDHLDVVKLLIEKGADQDIPDFTLNRPIHLVKSGSIANLLEYTDKENASGLSAIETAIINQNIDVVKVFIDKTKISQQRLLLAATIPNSDKSISFLSKTLKKDILSPMELLMSAVQNGSYEVFKYLIRQKFEIDYETRNSENENILQIIKRVGNVGISRYLEKDFKNKNKVLP